MPDAGNPFIPGQPVNSSALFLGRQEAITWIRENLVKDRRLMLISGASRIGKTSLLRQLSCYLPDTYTVVRVEMLDEDASQLDRLLWRLAGIITQQLNAQLGIAEPQPAWADFEGHTERLLDAFWPQLRAALGRPELIVQLDDADTLLGDDRNLLGPLLAVLEQWSAQDANLSLILTLTLTPQELAARANLPSPDHLPVYQLGPLSSEDAIRLINEPVAGIITYDYGVSRRLVEITSGQPYYLQLLCFEIFNRCAAAGWVNQRDVDAVVEQLIKREIPDFQQIWHESSPHEQVALAAFVSLRGARGLATALEIHTALTNAGMRVERDQVAEVLDHLATRGILERLGALSYRFRLTLLADWLRERLDLATLARSTRWSRDRERLPAEQPPELLAHSGPSRPQQEAPSSAPDDDQTQQVLPGRRAWWPWLVAAVVTVLVLGSLALAFWPRPAQPTPTAAGGSDAVRPTVLRSTAAPSSVSTPLPGTPLPTALPTVPASATSRLTPTPTPPVIVSHPLPAIAYQSLPSGAKNWAVYVMDSRGENPLRLTDEQASAISPAWSPDGNKIAFVSSRDGNFDIWVMNGDGSNPVDLTHSPAQDRWPAWSPDGEWIAFASVRDSPYWELYIMRADGSGVRRVTWWEDASDVAPAWSPDGKWLAFASRRDGNWEIYVVDRDGRNLVRLTVDPADDTNPTWSPDGTRIAFESTRTGYSDLFVMPAAGGEAANLTNTPFSSDHGPTWSPDGGRIAFYSDRDGEWDIYVMAVDGSNVVNLTGDGSDDEAPAWRP